MTLDEAIIHAEEVANSGCTECNEEHRQLAVWLRELQLRREYDDARMDNCITRKELLDSFPPMQPDSAAIVKKVVTEAFPIRLWVDVEDTDIALEAWYDYSKKDFGNIAWTLLNESYSLSDNLRDNITHWMPYPKTPYNEAETEESITF